MTVILPGGIGQIFAPVSYSALDPTNNTTYANLSNNNRTQTCNLTPLSGNYGSTRGTRSNNSGKKYFEFTASTIDNNTSTAQVFGLCDAGWPANSGASLQPNKWDLIFPGSTTPTDTHSCCIVPAITGSPAWGVFYETINPAPASTALPAAANGTVIGVAADFTTPTSPKIYFRVGTIWNNNGAGGTTLTTADVTLSITGGLYPVVGVSAQSNATVNIINVGNAAFANAPPAGYTAWG